MRESRYEEFGFAIQVSCRECDFHVWDVTSCYRYTGIVLRDSWGSLGVLQQRGKKGSGARGGGECPRGGGTPAQMPPPPQGSGRGPTAQARASGRRRRRRPSPSSRRRRAAALGSRGPGDPWGGPQSVWDSGASGVWDSRVLGFRTLGLGS